MEDRLLTPIELCERYSISRFTVYKWASLGLIPYIKLRGSIRFRQQDLLRWEENKLTGAPTTKLL